MATIVTTVVSHPPPYPRGRRCRKRGCDTLLSGYNPTPRCWVHDGWGGEVRNPQRHHERRLAGEYLTEVLGL